MPTVVDAARVTTKDTAVWRTCIGCEQLRPLPPDVNRCAGCAQALTVLDEIVRAGGRL